MGFKKCNIVIYLDISNNASDDRLIYLMNTLRSSTGASDISTMIKKIYIDYEDLTLYEKLTGNISIKITYKNITNLFVKKINKNKLITISIIFSKIRNQLIFRTSIYYVTMKKKRHKKS